MNNAPPKDRERALIVAWLRLRVARSKTPNAVQFRKFILRLAERIESGEHLSEDLAT